MPREVSSCACMANMVSSATDTAKATDEFLKMFMVSLVYAIGAYDMLKGFEVAGKNFGRPIEAYLAAAVLYFVMCYALSWMVKRLHQKIAIIR